MESKEQMRAEYEYRSEVLSYELRRDDWQRIALALNQTGAISLEKDIQEFLQSQEVK